MTFSPKAATGKSQGLLGDVTLQTKSLGSGEKVREWTQSGRYGSEQHHLRKAVAEKLKAVTGRNHFLRMALEELRQHVNDSHQRFGHDSVVRKELKDALTQAEAT